ncbi:uncharacterized protein LOC124694684 [Lolium rigidum]|uniref:uncharacterized protein LOC124694684 n=1 Tax=Lolium rigidum TaxID=89674 RepID=UPI001F5D3969|nr:uncharacterized protein LOC124694684 [Lolium rigidum]
MRIRRYAARLLASSAASSPPPPPGAAAAAPWLHAAADDCAFCDLTRGSDPQVAPDGIKHKGHTRIASPEPEVESDSDDLAELPPAPQAQRREIDHEHSAREDAGGLEATGGAAASPESQAAPDRVKHKGHIAGPEPQGELKSAAPPPQPRALKESIPAQRCEMDYEQSASGDAVALEVTGRADAKPEYMEETTLSSELATELAVKRGPFVVDISDDEQEAGGTSPLVNVSVADPEATGGVSLVSRSIAGPEVAMGVPSAGEAAAEREVSVQVSLASGSIAVPEFIMGASLAGKAVAQREVSEEVIRGAAFADEAVAEREVYEGVSLESGSGAEPQVIGGASLADEAVADQEISGGVSLSSEATTEAATVVTALGVTTGVPLDTEGIAEPDCKTGASPVDESAAEIDKMEASSSVNEAAAEMDKMEASSVNESAAEMGVTRPGSFVIEAATDPGLPERVSLPNEAATEREVSEGVSPASETAAEPPEMDVIRLDSHVIEAAADPGHSERVSLANKTTTEREVSEGVSLLTEAATEPADVVTALEVTTGAPLDNAGAAVPETKMEASLVNESATQMDCVRLGSPTIEATTHTRLAERVSLVSEVVTETGIAGAANLDTEFFVEPEATGGPSLVNECSELEIAEGVSIAKEAAAEPEVTGEAYVCSEDADAALNKTRPPHCDLDCATVQVENVGVSVRDEVQPSRDDAADEVVSVSSMSTGPAKSPTADEVTPHDDTPSISCVSGIVARSVGKSGRTDIICYARRSGKRKLDMAEMKTDQIEMGDGDICDQCEEKATLDRTAPCESAMSTAGSVEIKLADIKRDPADNSASSRCKRRKGRYECDIDYCRMTFKKKTELSVHKKNMCVVKSCGKHFRCHKYLRRHHSTHNEDAPYKCPWEDCTMAFKWRCSLADHFQVHTGEKPYKCRSPGCSKIYKYVSDFIRHKKRCKPQR